MGLRMENFNVLGIHWKIWFLGRGRVHETPLQRGYCLKKGLRQFADLRGNLFVANRVQQIRDHISPKQCHYIQGSRNPVNNASWGLDSKKKDQIKRCFYDQGFPNSIKGWGKSPSVARKKWEILLGEGGLLGGGNLGRRDIDNSNLFQS